MPDQTPSPGEKIVIAKRELQSVFDALDNTGYSLVGPTLSGEAIIHDQIETIDDLPIGWTTEVGPAEYRLKKRDDEQFFSYTTGPHSWKRFLYPPRVKLFSASRNGKRHQITSNQEPTPAFAFIGARACDVAAIHVHDQILMQDMYRDPHYVARREKAFILAVNCTEPGNTCFCASMGTGPRCTGSVDLVLTELDDVFIVEIGSPLGAQMLADTQWRPADEGDVSQADERMRAAENRMGRVMDPSDMPDLLYDNLEHPRWDDVAARCLSCTNCTQVCPTCFCTDVEDVSDLIGEETERVRVWDSCFNLDFSYVHGGQLRPNIRSRYRQWLTHKLASWIDQFGTSGCVGCGRCITWCPVGIDLTEEVAAIRGEA
jgi:ferredoxin